MASEEAEVSVVFGGTGKDARTELREPALARVESDVSTGRTADTCGTASTGGDGSGSTADARGTTDTGDVSGGVAIPVGLDLGGHDLLGGMGSTLAPQAQHGMVAPATTSCCA